MAQYTPKTWVTGETITAAELNALEQAAAGSAVLADVGTAGTATGDALRGAVGRQAAAYVDPTSLPNGTSLATLPSGQVTQSFGSSPFAVSGGRLIHTPYGHPSAGYLQADLGKRVGRIGADVHIPTGATGAVAFVLPSGRWDQGTFVEAGIHFVVSRDKWSISHWNGSGEDMYSLGTFATPLDDNGSHRIDLTLDGSTAYLSLPDGSTVRVQDPRIQSTVSTWVIWELYEDDAAVDAPLSFDAVWADGVPAGTTAAATPVQIAATRSATPQIPSYARLLTSTTTVIPVSEVEIMRHTIVIPNTMKFWVRLACYMEISAQTTVFFVARVTTVNGGSGQVAYDHEVLSSASYAGNVTVEDLVDLAPTGFTPGGSLDIVWTAWSFTATGAQIVTDGGGTKVATMLFTPVTA